MTLFVLIYYTITPPTPTSCILQLTPLLLVTDHDSGGYNMDDSEIGVVLMSAAVLQLGFQVYAYMYTSRDNFF